MNLIADTTLERYPELSPDVRIAQHAVTTLETKLADVAAQRELTPMGRLRVADREATSHFDAVRRLEQKAQILADDITRGEHMELTLRSAADGTAGRVQVDPHRPRNAEQLHAERFVWDQLRTMKQLDAELFYMDAIQRGDHDLIEMVERIPRPFGLRPDALDRGRRARLELSPGRDILNKKREDVSVLRNVNAKTRDLLTGLVQQALQLAENRVSDELRRLDPGFDFNRLRTSPRHVLTQEAQVLQDELAQVDAIRIKHLGR